MYSLILKHGRMLFLAILDLFGFHGTFFPYWNIFSILSKKLYIFSKKLIFRYMISEKIILFLHVWLSIEKLYKKYNLHSNLCLVGYLFLSKSFCFSTKIFFKKFCKILVMLLIKLCKMHAKHHIHNF